MLDNAITSQLRSVFTEIDRKIELRMIASEHDKQHELRELIEGVAACSDDIEVREQAAETTEASAASSTVPQVSLVVDGLSTGVSFRGVPGGHEFTSLVIAILNAAGKGRLPDDGVAQRIRALKGPIRLRTFVSLDCTNCPDVIQALNLMSLLHDDFSHQMIDGALVPDEVKRLGVQGVPAVFDGDNLLHVGKADLAALLDQLEEHAGSVGISPENLDQEADVVVIGGGPAGAAAAIYSARKGLNTVVVAGRIGGQVKDTLGIENLINTPYTEGPLLANDLRANLEAAGVRIMDNRMVKNLIDDEIKIIELKGGERIHSPQVIITTGAKWRELGIPGEKEHIGRGVAFCPHCDGPFYKGKRVAVVGGGNSGIEAAIDLAGICAHVTVVEFDNILRADEVLQRKLHSLPNVDVITSARSTEVLGSGEGAEDGEGIRALQYEDRSSGELKELSVDGIFVQIGLVPNSAPFRELLELNRRGEIVVDSHGRTSSQGIYAAGDVATIPYKQIIIAMGDGAKAALAAFEDRMRAEEPVLVA